MARDRTSAHYYFTLGIIAIKVGKRTQALEALQKVIALATAKHQVHLANYYIARIQADRGNVRTALALLAEIIADKEASAKLRRAAQDIRYKLHKKGRAPLNVPAMSLMFQQADMLSYR